VDTLEDEIDALQDLAGLTSTEIASINARRATLNKQLGAAQQALNNCRKSHPR